MVPRDSQEGEEIAIAGHDFDLLMGQPVVFPLASSSVRADDKPGDLVRADPDSIRELPPLQSLMRVSRKAKAERAPVSLAARVTEVGTIELWCQSRTDDRRWRLADPASRPCGALVPRGSVTGDESDHVVIEQSELDAATAAIRVAFEDRPASAATGPVDGNGTDRAGAAGEAARRSARRSARRVAALGACALVGPAAGLGREKAEEPAARVALVQPCGFLSAPGARFPLDDVRIKALWPIFHQGVKHIKDVQCWAEWWILWRRVAAGLARPHHEEIHRRLVPFLLPAKGSSPAKKAGRPKPEAHELAEMWRCAASLERVAPELKEALGDALIKELSQPSIPAPMSSGALARLGARVPLYGPANTVVRKETAERWTRSLLDHAFAAGRETGDAIFALAQLARVANDRARDLEQSLRETVIARLIDLGADEDELQPGSRVP